MSENKWIDWEPRIVNYLSTIIGINGVRLSYVVRSNDTHDQIEPFENFTEECISYTPLNCVDYEANRSTVHQSLISFTTCQPLDDWIKHSHMLRDGVRSLTRLRNHFSGEENSTRRITDTARLTYTLHYKNERSLPFETFLSKC